MVCQLLAGLVVDTWDGTDGQPIIYHGRTLTSKIRFKDVVKTIKEHAFSASQFPIFLSIEDHCSINQQKILAQVFREEFGCRFAFRTEPCAEL